MSVLLNLQLLYLQLGFVIILMQRTKKSNLLVCMQSWNAEGSGENIPFSWQVVWFSDSNKVSVALSHLNSTTSPTTTLELAGLGIGDEPVGESIDEQTKKTVETKIYRLRTKTLHYRCRLLKDGQVVKSIPLLQL